MKKILFLLLLTGCFLPAWVGTAMAQEYSMSAMYQTATTNRFKCGWPEFTNACPPKVSYYLQQTFQESVSWSYVDSGWETDSGSLTCQSICRSIVTNNGCLEIQTNATGNYNDVFSEITCPSNIWVTTTTTGTADMTNWVLTTTYSDGMPPFTTNYPTVSCGDDNLGGGTFYEPWIGSVCEASDGTSITQMQSITTNSIDCTESNITATSTRTVTLTRSAEDPTSRLIQPMQVDTNWQSGTGGASFDISGDQSTAGMTGNLIKFQISVPSGLEFTIPYVVHCHMNAVSLNSNTVVAETNIYFTNTISGTGCGSPVWYPSGDGIALKPPYGIVDSGCSQLYYGGSADLSILGWICLDDGKDQGCAKLSCPSCNNSQNGSQDPQSVSQSSQSASQPGMPRWWVTEPYINLWVADKPVEYVTSLGEKLGFQMTYKQHDTRPALINGQKPFMPANGWNNNWYSYVHFLPGPITNADGSVVSWAATVYEPGGGEAAFQAGGRADANSGDTLLSLDGVDGDAPAQGFRLVYPDGSQQIYALVTPVYPTTYQSEITIMNPHNETSTNHVWIPGQGVFTASETIDGGVGPQCVAETGGTLVYGKPGQISTNFYIAKPDWTNIVDSVPKQVLVTMSASPSADALMTEEIDPQGHIIRFNYGQSGSTYQLQSVVDYDGLQTTLHYDTNGCVTNICMPYGRTASFVYAAGTNAQLMSVTDAQNMTSTFAYQSSGYLAGMTTPYGTTSFNYYETNPASSTKAMSGLTRAIQITRPDQSHEMYAFFASDTNGAPYSYSSAEVPNYNNTTFDNGSVSDPLSAMYLRNSYYWGPAQFANLSIQDPAHLDFLGTNDFRLGRMSHWMLESDKITVSGAVSLEQEPSPDGLAPGQKTWYGNCSDTVGDDWKPTLMVRIMPNGDVWSQTMEYQSGLLASVFSSCTEADGSENTRGVSYNYQGVTYSEIVAGNTTTWYGSWLSGVSGPNQNYSVSGIDQIAFSDNRPSGSVTGTYPHYYQQTIYDGVATTTKYFDNSGHVTGISLPTGLHITNFFNGSGFLSKSIALEIQATNTYAFANGLLGSRLDPHGLLTTYSWDQLNRLTGIGFPDGTCVSNEYSRLNLSDTKDRLNHWTHAGFDNLGRMTAYTNCDGKVTTYDYCTCGGLNSVTDPLLNTTTYNRNLAGWVNSITFANAANSQTSRTFGRDSWGRPTNITDSCGLNLKLVYNIQGRPTNVYSPAGLVYAATYNEADQPLTQCNADGIWVTNNYDGVGRVLDQDFASGISRHNSYYGWLRTSSTDGLGNQTSYGYDPAGRLISTADASGFYTNGFAYNPAGQMVALADGNGHVTSWAYDVYGRMICKTNGNGLLVETNAYDANGRLVAHWTPAGGKTQYSYDANGNLLTKSYSVGTGISATYDGLDRLLTMTDALGTSGFTYQNFGAFMGAVATEHGPWASDTVTHAYLNRLPSSLTLAQPSGSFGETFSYDGLARLQSLTSPAGTFAYSYTGAGRLVQGINLGGLNIANQFDGAGQLLSTALKSGNSTLDAYAYAYDANGNRTSVQRANNATVTYGYDDIGELTSAQGAESGGLLRANENFTYGYDGARNLAFRTNNTLQQSFITDNANQLLNVVRNNNVLTVAGSVVSAPGSLTVNGAGANIYGDLTFAVASGLNIVDGANTLTNVLNGTITNTVREVLPVTAALRYDANGNLLWDGVLAYMYDCANELTSVTVTNGWRTQYAYDGFGRRRVKQEYSWSGNSWNLTNQVNYVYDGMSVIQERNGNNQPVASYTRGLDLSGKMQGAGGIGGLLARTDANGSTYYHADGNGNVTMLANSSGTVMARYLYDSFGNTLGMWGTLAVGNTYRFSSKEIDTRSGLYYYGYRYYEPNLQRWLNQDPIGERGGLNLYEYVGNSPVNAVDPLGLAPGYGNPISGPNGPVGPSPFGGAGYGIGFNGPDPQGPVEALYQGYNYALDQITPPINPNTDPYSYAASQTARGAAFAALMAIATDRLAPPEVKCPNTGSPKYPGSDPAVAPPGTQWRGKPGTNPGDPQGSYYNPNTGESYHPDLNHPDPVGPHWDYVAPDGTQYRIMPDGTLVPKK